MNYGKLYSPNIRIASEAILGVMSLLCGCLIYLLFRSENINIYKWCSSLGIINVVEQLRYNVSNYHVSDFAKFSLPDGLYCVAYIFIVDALWHNEKTIKHWIVALIPVIAIVNEILQYFGVVNGTFDWYDLISYATPLFLYFILTNYSN